MSFAMGAPTMRAVQFDRFGGPEVLELRSVEVPTAGPSEVLVRVDASGLNPKDAMFRASSPTPWRRPRFPRGTGFDFTGEVAVVGAEVSGLAVGQRVWGFLDGVLGGAAADYLLARPHALGLRPESLDPLRAAALPLVGSAALQALRDVARLRPGERLLIKGASGGVGSAAIQIGRAMGARVTAIASGVAAERCRALGAHTVAAEPDLFGVGSRTHFDVFLDCAGSSSLARYIRLLSRRGRWVTVAPNVPVFILSPFAGVTRRLRAPHFGYVVVRPKSRDLDELSRLVTAGRLRPMPVEPFTLEQVRAAHAALSTRGRNRRPVFAISPAALSQPLGPGSQEVA